MDDKQILDVKKSKDKLDLNITGSTNSKNVDNESKTVVVGEEVVELVDVCNFNTIYTMCDDGGRWQLKKSFIILYSAVLSGFHNIVYVFIGHVSNYTCQIKGLTNEQVKTLATPNVTVDGKTGLDHCHHYSINYIKNSTNFSIDRQKIVKCDSFKFNNSVFESTIPSDWNLVCDKAQLTSTIQGIFIVGVLVGNLVFGTMADKYGRKKAIIAASLLFLVAAPLVAASPNYIVAIITRFAVGMAEPGVFGTSFVLLIEILAPKWREVGGTSFNLPYGIGYMALAGFGYFLRNWRYLQLGICTPILIQVALLYFVPESPRWLIKKQRYDAAEKLLREIAKENKKELPPNFRELIENVAKEEKTDSDEHKTLCLKLKIFFIEWIRLFKTPKIRLRTLILYFSWMSVSMVYYGVAFILPQSEDPFLYVFIGGALELPSTFIVMVLIKYIGRRITFSGFFFICGLALLFTLLFEVGSLGITVLALTGKAAIASSLVLIYVYAAEMFPTLIRSTAIGSANMVGHIGSFVSPYIITISDSNKSIKIPMIIFGSLSLVAGFLSILLPETANKKMPETIEDVETKPILPIPAISR